MLGCILVENAMGWAFDPCLHQSLRFDELKHVFVRFVLGCVFK